MRTTQSNDKSKKITQTTNPGKRVHSKPRTVGNELHDNVQSVGYNFMTLPLLINRIQPKLKINQPNDKYEQEADRVAEKVMRSEKNSPAGTFNVSGGKSDIQRKCAACEKEDEKIQRKPLASQIAPLVPVQLTEKSQDEKEVVQMKSERNTLTVRPAFQNQLENTKRRGTQLPADINRNMSNVFGMDLSHLKVHNDSIAQ